MSCVNLLSIFSLLFILTSCQVKEKESSGGLVAGHKPTTNTFTVSSPATDAYSSGDTINFNVSFPFDVTVTGPTFPRLKLKVGASTVYAAYASGDGSKDLVFSYTVGPGDNDPDGIELNSLELNGGTLTFDSNGAITDCDISSVTYHKYTNVTVDNSSPTISSFALTNANGFYRKDDYINFTATFNEPVIVVGVPQVAFTLQTGGATFASYSAGSGTNVLTFRFQITNAFSDTNAYNSLASAVTLPAGVTIKDTAGNNAVLTFTNTAALTKSTTVNIDGRLPYVISVTAPPNATYISGNVLDFIVTFDRSVTISGLPYIELTIGSNTRQAQWVSSGASATHTFRYQSLPGDYTMTGITVGPTIIENSSTINGTAAPTTCPGVQRGAGYNAKCYFGHLPNNFFLAPNGSGIKFNSIQPEVTSVSRAPDSTVPVSTIPAPADNIWIIGQELIILVEFNTNVYVDQGNGTPRIPITIGATPQYATYLSGGDGQTTLSFRYVVQDLDEDTDGSVAIGPIDLNGGHITDVALTNAFLTFSTTGLASTKIDGIRPKLSVSSPLPVTTTPGTYSAVAGSPVMNLTLNWSEPVHYSATTAGSVTFPVTINGAAPTVANYVSGNDTATIIHRATITAGMNDVIDGIAIGSPLAGAATIKDLPGNLSAPSVVFIPPSTPTVFVDTTTPTVTLTTPPAAGTYKAGDNLDFIVTFSEVVNASGAPRIAINLNSGVKYANYLSGTGTSTLTFRYTVTTTDSHLVAQPTIVAPTVISIAAGSYIRDIAWNGYSAGASNYLISTSMTGIIVDGVAPTITAQTFTNGNGTYSSGAVLKIRVTYDEAVIVTETAGVKPSVNVGGLQFNYASGSGTTIIDYEYTVTSSDFDFVGLASPSLITLNTQTIKDANDNDADLTFTSALNLASVFIAYPNTAVWARNTLTNRIATGPTISPAGAATSQACGSGATCRIFNGDDSLSLTSNLLGVETIYMVFKTPAVVATSNLFSSDIMLINDSTVFDLDTANATIYIDGVLISPAAMSHDINKSPNTYHVLQVNFSPARDFYSALTLIPTSYLGAIGEIIVINGALGATEKDNIRSYLSTRFP